MNVGFTLIGGKEWMGGYNYLVNLFRVIHRHSSGIITPVLFAGDDIPDDQLAVFRKPAGDIVRSSLLNRNRRFKHLTTSLLLFRDRAIESLYHRHRVEAVFENAMFYGPCFNIPVITWIPDFQHRHLPELFGFFSYWKREMGFRAQIYSNRTIMVSSQSAKEDCETFYPRSRGRTIALPFAVDIRPDPSADSRLELIGKYRLPKDYFFVPNQMYKHKNHSLIIKGMKYLQQMGETAHIVCTGQPWNPHHPDWFNFLKTLTENLRVDGCFHFLGMIPYQDIVGLMQASKAVINPSLFEGWSTTVEEAKSLDVPMILSDIAVHREQADKIALFFDPHSPEGFAKTIQKFLKGNHPGASKYHMQSRNQRLTTFAKGFEKVVYQAISRHRKNTKEKKK